MEMAAITAEEFFSEPEPPDEKEHDEVLSDDVQHEAPPPEPAADLAAKEAELKRKEAELNKWNMRIAEREKALAGEPKPEPKKADGELPPLSEDAEKVLDDFIQRRLGSKLGVIDTLFQDTIDAELENFAASKGVEADVLRETLAASGIQPKEFSRRGFREAFSAAYDIHQSRSFDRDAEREKMKAEILAELKEQGIRPDSVEPSSRVDLDSEPVNMMDDGELSPADKYNAILSKLRKG